jgi:hypothetical protein
VDQTKADLESGFGGRVMAIQEVTETQLLTGIALRLIEARDRLFCLRSSIKDKGLMRRVNNLIEEINSIEAELGANGAELPDDDEEEIGQ